jgi:hypothetical protein
MRQTHQFGELRRQYPIGRRPHRGEHFGADQRRRDRQVVNGPVAIAQQVAQVRGPGRTVPDPIVAPLAGPHVVIGARHRVAQHLLARRQREGETREQIPVGPSGDIRLGDEAAPGDVACVLRFDLGHEPAPRRRSETVGPDEQIRRSGNAVGEARDHGIALVADVAQTVTQVIARRRESGAERVVEPVPGGQHLRIGHLGKAGTIGVEDAARGYGNTAFRPDRHAGLGQHGKQVGMRDDAGTAAGERALGPLVDVDRPAVASQQQRRRQPGDGAADDDGRFSRVLGHLSRSFLFIV